DFGFPRVRWAKDGHTFTYQKVDRGHQRVRLIEVDALAGTLRNLIDEKSDTFIWTQHYEAVAIPFVTWLENSDELLYCTEKSGWRRLSLVDAKTGEEKAAITPDKCVVRSIVRIDEENRQLWFRACGLNPEQEPYFIHYYRVNFDGTGRVPLTEAD